MEQNEKKKFSKGALIGIIAGAVVLVIVVIAVMVALIIANNKKENPDMGSEEITNSEAVSPEEPEEKTEEIKEDKTEDKSQDGPFTVTFRYNGKDFGIQTVEKGENAEEPLLMPAEEGSWDFDFSTAIEADTEIEWK